MKALGAQGALSLVSRRGRAEGPRTYPLEVAVLQSESFDGQARFSVMYQWDRAVEYRVVGAGPAAAPVSVTRENPRELIHLDLVRFDGLPTERDLTLEIREDGELLDSRVFRSLDRSRRTVRVGLLSCMKDHLHDAGMWESLRAQGPELRLFIGDNVYADNNADRDPAAPNMPVTPDQMSLRFSQSRAILSVFGWKRLVPIHATWDDHDFGGDDSDRRFPYAREAKEKFSLFFGRDENASLCSYGPGI